MPTIFVKAAEARAGIVLTNLLVLAGLCVSKGEARRLISQGGVSVNDKNISDANAVFSEKDFVQGTLILRKGKKQFRKVSILV